MSLNLALIVFILLTLFATIVFTNLTIKMISQKETFSSILFAIASLIFGSMFVFGGFIFF